MRRKKKIIYLDLTKAITENLIVSREDWFEKYCNKDLLEKSTYNDICKGAPLLVCVDGLYILDKDIEKCMTFNDRVYWAQIEGVYNILKWNRRNN